MKDKHEDDFFEETRQDEQGEQSLIAMLGGYDRGDASEARVGDKIKGTITRIAADTVFVDVGMRSEATMSLTEFMDKSGAASAIAGQAVEAYVSRVVQGNVELTQSMTARSADGTELIEAMKNRIPVEGKVTGINKGGLQVKVMGKAAFCPVSQIELHYVEDANVYLNRTLSFVIDKVTEGGRNIVLTRHPILEEGMVKRFEELEALAGTGKQISATVTKIMDFGLFADCGGVEGLVHISEVSWSRAENLAESFEKGQVITCVVQKIERREPLKTSRISLSIKQAGEDPWDSVSEQFAPGTLVQGKVTRCADFGAFVEIAPGVEGLVHISEMSWIKRVNRVTDVVSVGQQVTVTVLAIDLVKRTVSLTLKDVADDPWKEAQDRFAIGTALSGTVASQTRFGYFIDLADGVTGLLPFGNIAPEHKDKLKVGDTVTTIVNSVDPEKRRISLSLGVAEAAAEDAAAREYIKKEAAPAAQPAVSEFAASLMSALKNKK